MLDTIKGLLRNRRDRQEMLNMRAMMGNLHALIFPENQVTGALVRMKAGLFLRQNLERRLGIMGPDFLERLTLILI